MFVQGPPTGHVVAGVTFGLGMPFLTRGSVVVVRTGAVVVTGFGTAVVVTLFLGSAAFFVRVGKVV